MSNIKLGSEKLESGKVVYNASIIHGIVALAIEEVEGALPLKGKKDGIALKIERECIYADVSVIAKVGFDVPELAYRIQQSVIHSVENMTNYKVAKVDVHVVDVVFVEQTVVEEPAETEETEICFTP
jgi:uncharacterized alkaline shock family protein YloU